MTSITTAETAAALLDALGEQLARSGASYELVVVGGSALLALGLVTRPTKDVDLVALRGDSGLLSVSPLPPPLAAARDRVARDFRLPSDWLNEGPGKHEADLRALEPSAEELVAAARWSRGHDPSPGYRHVLEQALVAFGVRDATLGP